MEIDGASCEVRVVLGVDSRYRMGGAFKVSG